MTETTKKKRVCVIGAGAAGSSCAWLLGKHPDLFEVDLWEKTNVAGGVATAVKINDKGLFINDGVQGGSYSYRNTLLLHKVNVLTKIIKHNKTAISS
jgi:predicted NAD/FAD-binding protein